MSGPTKSIGKDKAIELYDSGFWKDMTHRERAVFQMEVAELCMPFGVFHEALENALGRPVWTHEIGANHSGLLAELHGKQGPPTMQEIVEMIPADKRIIVALAAPAPE